MDGKPVSVNRVRLAQAATGISPADYPLGSLESRAAMRAVIDQANRMKPQLSQYDADASLIHFVVGRLSDNTTPRQSEMKSIEIYRHAEELDTRRAETTGENWRGDSGTRLEKILNNLLCRSGEPQLTEHPPEIRHEVALYLASALMLTAAELAWERQLPDLPFPIRLEDDARLYLRRPSGQWEGADEWETERFLGPVKKIREWEAHV